MSIYTVSPALPWRGGGSARALSRALADLVISVSQRMHVIVLYVPFVVESTQTQFRDLNSIHYERTKSAPGCTAHVSQDPEEVLVPNALSHVMFWSPFAFTKHFDGDPRTRRLYILALKPTNSSGGVDPV